MTTRIRDLMKHLEYLEQKMKKDLNDSMEQLENGARVKVSDAVDKRM